MNIINYDDDGNGILVSNKAFEILSDGRKGSLMVNKSLKFV
jgi:hypothetical protein